MPLENRMAMEVSRKIDQRNHDDQVSSRGKVKVLVLGAGESGKSTILKQLRILYGEGVYVCSGLPPLAHGFDQDSPRMRGEHSSSSSGGILLKLLSASARRRRH
jgi:hypothetical protein